MSWEASDPRNTTHLVRILGSSVATSVISLGFLFVTLSPSLCLCPSLSADADATVLLRLYGRLSQGNLRRLISARALYFLMGVDGRPVAELIEAATELATSNRYVTSYKYHNLEVSPALATGILYLDDDSKTVQ